LRGAPGCFNPMNRLTVEGLLQDAWDRLGLIGTTGQSGFMNNIGCVKVQRYMESGTFRGSLHPQTILILSSSDFASLMVSPYSAHEQTFNAAVSSEIPCIVLSRVPFLPDFMIHLSEVYHVPLLISIFDEFLLESRLLQILREKINQVVMMHGALASVNGIGVMITGESGTGKTTCAIRLAQAGHFWIADDVIEIIKKNGAVLYGRSHEMVRNILEMKNIGIVDARHLLGEVSVREETVVNIMFKFVKSDHVSKTQGDDTFHDTHDIMGVKLPCMHVVAGSDEERTAGQIDFVTRNFSHGDHVL
jgi:HPr kinase/phosphorylase